MKVSKEEITYIAKLANLKFTDEETEKMSEEITNILDHFDNISNENLEGIDMYSFEDHPLRLRDDEVKEFEDRDILFQNTKTMSGTSIEIPKVVE